MSSLSSDAAFGCTTAGSRQYQTSPSCSLRIPSAVFTRRSVRVPSPGLVAYPAATAAAITSSALRRPADNNPFSQIPISFCLLGRAITHRPASRHFAVLGPDMLAAVYREQMKASVRNQLVLLVRARSLMSNSEDVQKRVGVHGE